MLESRNYIPKYITEKSTDIHVFLKLLDLVVNNAKSKSDDFINILNPDKCPNELLPILSSYLGYKYDYNISYDNNRTILRSYRNMMRNKGSITGIKLATSVAISMVADKSLLETSNLYSVSYYDNYYICNTCGYIQYNEFDTCPVCGSTNIENYDKYLISIVIGYPKYSYKIYDLVEAVRPAGFGCNVYNGSLIEQIENIDIQDYIMLQNSYLNSGGAEVGGKDAVSGFVEIPRLDSTNHKYCTSCGYTFYECTPDYSTNTEYNIGDRVIYTNNGSSIIYECKEYLSSEDNTQFDIAYWNQIRDEKTCPRCGRANKVKNINNSNLRLLYRLYNENRALDVINKQILMDISTGDTINSDRYIGIVLRLHIKQEDAVPGYQEFIIPRERIRSFIFGINPYIILDGDNDSSIELFTYDINSIISRLYNSNSDDLSTMNFNSGDSTNIISYKFGKDTSQNTCIIASTTNGVDNTRVFYYGLERVEVYSFHEFENISDPTYSNGIYKYNVSSSDYDKGLDFHLGYKNNDDQNDIIIPTITDESGTVVDFNNRYMRVCRLCNKLIDPNDNSELCPNCAGQTGRDNSINSAYDPTILKGSYIIDMYFGDNDY